MAKLYIKANDLVEKDSFEVYNESGKAVYYTKDDFLATGHRIKIFLSDTIQEVAYVQEKTGRIGNRFEFCARGDVFGTIYKDSRFNRNEDIIDFDDWVHVPTGDGEWNYRVMKGALRIMEVKQMPYLIPGKALNITDTNIINVDGESGTLIALAFALAVFACNKYDY